MKKLFALLMALCLMLTAFAAMAETTTDAPAQFEVYANVSEPAPYYTGNISCSFQISWQLTKLTGTIGKVFKYDFDEGKFVQDGNAGFAWDANRQIANITITNYGTAAVAAVASFTASMTGAVGQSNAGCSVNGFDAAGAFANRNLDNSYSGTFPFDNFTFSMTELPESMIPGVDQNLGTVTVYVSQSN